jgi:hypothetical protein
MAVDKQRFMQMTSADMLWHLHDLIHELLKQETIIHISQIDSGTESA